MLFQILKNAIQASVFPPVYFLLFFFLFSNFFSSFFTIFSFLHIYYIHRYYLYVHMCRAISIQMTIHKIVTSRFCFNARKYFSKFPHKKKKNFFNTERKDLHPVCIYMLLPCHGNECTRGLYKMHLHIYKYIEVQV